MHKGTVLTDRINMRLTFVEFNTKTTNLSENYSTIKKEILSRIKENDKIRKNSDSYLSESDDCLVLTTLIIDSWRPILL